jgi:hypothetical protein
MSPLFNKIVTGQRPCDIHLADGLIGVHQSQNLIRILLRRCIPLCTTLNQLFDNLGRVDIFRLAQPRQEPHGTKHKTAKGPRIHDCHPGQSRSHGTQLAANHGQKHAKERSTHLFEIKNDFAIQFGKRFFNVHCK